MSYRRSRENKRRLERLYDKTKTKSFSGCWFDDRKNRYIKINLSNTPGYTKYYKRVSNRKIRHMKETLNYGKYKKAFDYRWTMY